MAEITENKKVEKTLRELLSEDGYQLSPPRNKGEWGTDIVALDHDRVVHIEVCGYVVNSANRSRDFFEVFFRAISRLDDSAKIIVIALPAAARQGLPARAGHYKVAWKRIAITFPELEIWLINVKNKKYEKTSWIERVV